MVAENSIVCLLLEHNLMISFICSAKNSSNILIRKKQKQIKTLETENLKIDNLTNCDQV